MDLFSSIVFFARHFRFMLFRSGHNVTYMPDLDIDEIKFIKT
jgi:hypothetical protein